MNQAIADGKTGYCPGAGIMPLREALAADVGQRRGLHFDACNVVIQPGGKPVIGKFIQTVMNPGDEVLYPNPGYPIYESQIDYHGGKAVPYRYIETPTGFALDMQGLESLITPRTRVLIYNNLQNPLSCESSAREMAAGPAGRRTTCGCCPTRPTSRCATRARAPRSHRCPGWPSAR
jgi:aspartate/methionine/tyrosine aminotransferase